MFVDKRNKYKLGFTTASSGFTLMELLLVIAVLAVITAMSRDSFSSFLFGATAKDNAQAIAFDLRSARDQAMNGQDDRNWGVRFVNGADDYYEIFSSPAGYSDPAKEITRTDYLKSNVHFISPAEGDSQEVVFTKISGLTTAAEITVSSGQAQRTVSVNSQGLVGRIGE